MPNSLAGPVSTVALVVFGDSSRDDWDTVQPLLNHLMTLPLRIHLVFVPIPERMLNELHLEYWTAWAKKDQWRSMLFLPLVRVANLPWTGAGVLGGFPVFFIRSVSAGIESQFAEVNEFIEPWILNAEGVVESQLRCDLMKASPKADPQNEVWLSLSGGKEVVQKVRFLLDYLEPGPNRAEQTATDVEILQLKNELFEKEVTIKRLLRNEKRYRKFFEDDITGDFLMDLHWRVVDCNRTFARIFGFPSVDYALGFDLRQLFARRQDRAKVRNHFRQLNSLDYYELELLRSDGKPVNIIANLLGIRGDDGKLMQVRGFLFDNTPRKNLEKQLQESQKMEGLGRLAGGIAHDFNNLLTVINGYAEILIGDLSPESENSLELNEILQAGLKAAELTRQLLAFSRRQVLSPQVLDLNDVVKKMETILQRLMTERIKLHLVTDPGLVRLKADKGQLEQVILNLVLNARDAMPNGGELTVRTERVTVDSTVYDSSDFLLPGNYVCLEVQDTGIGMDEEVQKRIFEPFFTTKTMGKGTGLGLAMVYGIVQQSGGSLRVQSKPGAGSTFTIYFESHESKRDKELTDESSLPVARGHQEKVILVEDEDMVREYTNRILKKYGYVVKTFRDGKQAFDFLKSTDETWDVVLTDIVMPFMTGPELSLKLREEGIDIAFLYMSGYTDDEIIRHGVSSNQVMFIHKPFKSKELLSKMKEVLDSRKE